MLSRLRRRLPLLLFTFLFVVPVFFGIVRAASLDQPDFENNLGNGQNNIDNSVFTIGVGFIQTGNVVVGGCSVDTPEQPCAVKTSAIQGTTKMVASLWTKQFSFQQYLADVLQDMEIESAYAQGLGFSSLRPVLQLWKIFRNIAYLFFVFIFLAIGFGIMFRQNLGGQTAITIQQALPKIIVALVMVTFSYAIAGLLIDLMYVVMFFLVALFDINQLFGSGSTLTNFNSEGNILSQNIFQVYGGIISGGFADNAGKVIQTLIYNMIATGGITDAISAAGSWMIGALGTLVLFFAILFAMFKTLFALMKVYVEIILSVIFAPIILMMGAVQANAFGNWVKGLIANLAVFPAMLIFIIIGYIFVGSDSKVYQTQIPQALNEGGFVPPFLPGRGAADTIGLIVGIGAIMLLSDVPTIMARFKPKSMFDDLGQMAMKNVAAGWSGGEIIPGVKGSKVFGARQLMPDSLASIQPFGIHEAAPYRISGKETGLERFFIGTRANRLKEIEYQRQAALFGRNVKIRQGGLAALFNARKGKQASQQQTQGGAGSQTL